MRIFVKSKKHQTGFTILELMIAISVFSMILLVCLGALTYIGRLYYKGVTVAKTQEISRNLVDSLADSVKFSNAAISTISGGSGWDGAYCIGARKYSYKNNRVLRNSPDTTKSQASQVLVESNDPSCRSFGSSPIPIDSTDFPAKELLGEFMRITDFNVTTQYVTGGRLVTVNVTVVYGGEGESADSDIFNMVAGEPVSCRTGVASSQFCAVSNLLKTVYVADR